MDEIWVEIIWVWSNSDYTYFFVSGVGGRGRGGGGGGMAKHDVQLCNRGHKSMTLQAGEIDSLYIGNKKPKYLTHIITN